MSETSLPYRPIDGTSIATREQSPNGKSPESGAQESESPFQLTSEQNAPPIAPWVDLLERTRQLSENWNRRGAPPPNERAIAAAFQFLEVMSRTKRLPTRLAPSAVGGIGITRRVNERFAYVEFYNNGPPAHCFRMT